MTRTSYAWGQARPLAPQWGCQHAERSMLRKVENGEFWGWWVPCRKPRFLWGQRRGPMILWFIMGNTYLAFFPIPDTGLLKNPCKFISDRHTRGIFLSNGATLGGSWMETGHQKEQAMSRRFEFSAHSTTSLEREAGLEVEFIIDRVMWGRLHNIKAYSYKNSRGLEELPDVWACRDEGRVAALEKARKVCTLSP